MNRTNAVLTTLQTLAVAGTCLFAAGSADAVEVNLTAEFRPSVLEPARNMFTNTTPNEGICATNPITCEGGHKSFKAGFDVAYGPMQVNAPDSEQAYFKVPGDARQVQVMNESGDVAEVTFRVTLFGGNYKLPQDVRIITGNTEDSASLKSHQQLWTTSSWVNSPQPCRYSGMGLVGHTNYIFAWRAPQQANASACVKKTKFDFASMDLADISYSYEMTSPSPLLMKNGVYKGRIEYSVGQGGDFDFGNNGTATTDVMGFNFTLTVDHEFQVDFPSAAPRVALAPVGGWTQWTTHNTAPTRLQQELPFTVSSSAGFGVQLRCEHDSGGRCGIEDQANGTIVPIDVDATMPGFSAEATGAPALNHSLPTVQSGTDATRFRPDAFAANRASKLRFSANGAAVAQMLDAPGSHWQGDVTLIFDSEL